MGARVLPAITRGLIRALEGELLQALEEYALEAILSGSDLNWEGIVRDFVRRVHRKISSRSLLFTGMANCAHRNWGFFFEGKPREGGPPSSFPYRIFAREPSSAGGSRRSQRIEDATQLDLPSMDLINRVANAIENLSRGSAFIDKVKQITNDLRSDSTWLFKSPYEKRVEAQKQLELARPDADRIARTTTMQALNMIAADQLVNAGVYYVTYSFILDERTSAICRDLSSVLAGRYFPIDRAPLPPFHPHCRTIIVARSEARNLPLEERQSAEGAYDWRSVVDVLPRGWKTTNLWGELLTGKGIGVEGLRVLGNTGRLGSDSITREKLHQAIKEYTQECRRIDSESLGADGVYLDHDTRRKYLELTRELATKLALPKNEQWDGSVILHTSLVGASDEESAAFRAGVQIVMRAWHYVMGSSIHRSWFENNVLEIVGTLNPSRGSFGVYLSGRGVVALSGETVNALIELGRSEGARLATITSSSTWDIHAATAVLGNRGANTLLHETTHWALDHIRSRGGLSAESYAWLLWGARVEQYRRSTSYLHDPPSLVGAQFSVTNAHAGTLYDTGNTEALAVCSECLATGRGKFNSREPPFLAAMTMDLWGGRLPTTGYDRSILPEVLQHLEGDQFTLWDSGKESIVHSMCRRIWGDLSTLHTVGNRYGRAWEFHEWVGGELD